MSATATGPSAADLLDFLAAVHGDQRGWLALFSGRRVPGKKKLDQECQAFFAYPAAVDAAAGWIGQRVAAGSETYLCAHLVTRRERTKPRQRLLDAEQ